LTKCNNKIKGASLFLALAFSVSSFCQSRWQPYLGLHVSGDAELFYLGPSFQLGTDFVINKKSAITGYVHYFPKKVNNSYTDGSFQKGKYRSVTAALLFEGRLGRTPNKGSFLAGGLAFQSFKDDFSSNSAMWNIQRNIIVPAIRIGYAFPFKVNKVTIEINATGPSKYKIDDNPFTGEIIEILTQLSIGTRLTF
jgi:hypothetical protein